MILAFMCGLNDKRRINAKFIVSMNSVRKSGAHVNIDISQSNQKLLPLVD